MYTFFAKLFEMNFMPHGSCFLWKPELIWLHAGSDGVIAAAYFVIPILLIQLVSRRKNLSYHWMFWMFAAFILLCGSTHIMSIVTLWQPMYRFEGIVKLGTAFASLGTAVALVLLLPKILQIPLPEELAAVNRALQQQIAVNRVTEAQLLDLNAELERRVAQRTAALERSNKELSQFAYIASHDLQEPLRMISNYTELLRHRYGAQLDDGAREFMSFTIDGARRMQRLIEDLLAYAQVERDAVATGTVSATSALNKALEALQLTLAEEGAEVTAENLPEVAGDERLVALVFQNVISNSLKYRSETKPRIQIWAVPVEDGTLWKFFVQDNGRGFDMRFKHRLFHMFQRIDTSRPGSGIGLATCRKIVEHQGGTIDVESKAGVGTTVWFTLRATQAIPKVI